MAPARAARVGALLATLADPGSEVRTVVVRMDGRVVSSNTSVVVGDDVALFSLATLPEYRGRGIGPATQVFLMQDAAARGAKRVVIESSAMGHEIYARLGFEDVGESHVYWRRAGGPNRVDRIRRRMRRP
jgi:ribosomal protein S18 acetylase RimI-like enzyme